MTPGLLFAAAGTETTEHAAATVIDFQTALMLVMVVCLAFMARSLAQLGRRVDELSAALTRATPASRGPAESAGIGQHRDLPPETMAVIAAAVMATCDEPVQIVAVDEVNADQARHWSLEGRRQIFTSHQIR